MRQALTNSILVIFGILASLLLVEVALRINFALENNTPENSSERSPDPILGFRVNANTPGYDQRGFRNVTALTEADIVTLGDSQTEGHGVAVENAWPQQLSRLGNLAVYNMGLAGYGPAQYYVLAKTELREINPKIVIVAVYMGNDLADAYKMVYEESNAYTGFQDPTIERGPNEFDGLWQSQWDLQQEYWQSEYKKRLSSPEKFLQENTRLYWWLVNRGIVNPTLPDIEDVGYVASRQWALDNPEDGMILESNGVKTVLNISLRSAVVDLSNRKIEEGLRLTMIFIGRIVQDMSEQQIKTLVIVIPTKELVFAHTAKKAGISNPGLDKCAEYELSATDRILRFCLDSGINCFYLLSSMREALDNGKRIYWADTNGHPTAEGQEVIAMAVFETLTELGWISGH